MSVPARKRLDILTVITACINRGSRTLLLRRWQDIDSMSCLFSVRAHKNKKKRSSSVWRGPGEELLFGLFLLLSSDSFLSFYGTCCQSGNNASGHEEVYDDDRENSHKDKHIYLRHVKFQEIG